MQTITRATAGAAARACAGGDRPAEHSVPARALLLTRASGRTTIARGLYERQRCRWLRVRGRDGRVRRSGGLQRDHGCIRRCIRDSGASALRGVGAPGARRAWTADQVDRRRSDVRICRPGNRPSGARTSASGLPSRTADSADEDRPSPRPRPPQSERPLRLDGQHCSAHRRVRVSRADVGHPANCRHCRCIRNCCEGHGEGGATIDCGPRAASFDRVCADLRSRLDRSCVQDARASGGIPQNRADGPMVLFRALRRSIPTFTGDLR